MAPQEVLGQPGPYLMALKMAPEVRDPLGRLDHHRARGPRSAEDHLRARDLHSVEDHHPALEVHLTSGSDSKVVPKVPGHPQEAEAVGVPRIGAEEGAVGSMAPGAQVVPGLLWGWTLVDKVLGS